MSLKHVVWLLGAGLLLTANLNAAQAESDSLRALADLSHFHIGAAADADHLAEPTYANTLSREFNMLTPENEAKFCALQPQRGQYDFSKFDQLVAYAAQHQMAVRGHTLVWDQCMPSWLASGNFSRDEAIQLMQSYISTVVGRYKGRVAIWDVVNEAIADDGSGLRDTSWKRWIGDDYIELAFKFAHQADPNALLFYNDYNAEGMNPKSDAVYQMVQGLLKDGVPINGVGLQTHINLGDTDPGGPVASDSLAQNVERLGKLGLQVQITEMDVTFNGAPNDDILRREAADYDHVLSTCLSSTYCTSFATWGVTDKYSWLRAKNQAVAPLLFDDNYQAKPAYSAVQNALAQRAGKPAALSDQPVAATSAPPKSDTAQLAPDSVPGTVYYAPFPVSIHVDGDASDWANVPRAAVASGPLMPPNNDTSMTFAAAADATNLYFLAEVHDSKVMYGTHDPTTDWYDEDSVEFYLNATGDLTLSSYRPGVVQIGIPTDNIAEPAQPLFGGINSGDTHVTIAAVKTSDGYRVEAAVPLVTNVWSIKPEQSGVLGFQAALNGTSGSQRDTKLIWSTADTQDQSWSNPSLFGRLSFWAVKQ